MRFLLIDADYAEFLSWLYSRENMQDLEYDAQIAIRRAAPFGILPFYAAALARQGHSVVDVYANNRYLQLAYAKANPHTDIWQARLEDLARCSIVSRRRPAARFVDSRSPRFYRVLADQIARFGPDVIVNFSLPTVGADFLVRSRGRAMLVGHHASPPLSDISRYRPYDLVFSSFPATLSALTGQGVRAEYLPLAFSPTATAGNAPKLRDIPVSFVGSFHKIHESRRQFLEELAGRVPELRVWGRGVDSLPASSPLHGRHCGDAWAADMFEILQRSRITINQHHGGVPPYANNLRLFEATGAGALLITDARPGLETLFAVGDEVITYTNAEECAARIRLFLADEPARMRIANAGQRRTLQEHTYDDRARRMVDAILRLRRPAP